MLPRIPFAALGILVIACGDPGATTSERASAPLEPSTRDSAGVTIHEHPGNALERAPLIVMDSVPVALFAGTADNIEDDVSSLVPFAFARDGQLVAFDQQATQLVVLPAGGGPARRFGRRGAGPGEFGRFGTPVMVDGDTVLYNDSANDRVAVISLAYGIVRELARPTGSRAGAGQLIGRDPSGVVYFAQWNLSSMTGGESAQRRQAITVQSWNGSADSLRDRFVGGEIRLYQEVRTSARGTTVMIRDAALSEAPMFRIWGDNVLIVPSEGWRLEQRDASGALRDVIRLRRPATAVDEAIWNRYVDFEVNRRMGFDSTAKRDDVTAVIDAEERIDSLPAFRGAVVTANQTLWLVDYRLPGDSGWAATALDRQGRILGRILEPGGEAPVAFGDDRLAFRSEDDDGIATITVRKIILP